MKVTKRIKNPFPAVSIDNFFPSESMLRSAANSFDHVKSEDWVIYQKDNGQVQYSSKIPRKSTPECLIVLDYIATHFNPSEYFDECHESVFPDLSHYGGGMMMTPNDNNQGGYLGMHVDASSHGNNKSWHRAYSAVLCISERYDNSFDLLVHDGEKNHDRLEYAFNRLNVFKCTENSWHGFPQITAGLNRKALGLMFWKKLSPKEQTSEKRIKAKFNNDLIFD